MSDDPAAVRSFVAIELPAEIRAFCQVAQDRARRRLGPAAAAVRWVDARAIHLTLKFLGGVPAERLPVLIARLRARLGDQPAFSLAVGQLGAFPGPRTPRVIWLAVLGDRAQLDACQERVEVATVPLGFPREKRAFRPHLTLGRVRETATPEQLAAIGSLPANWPPETSPPFPVTSVDLMQSQLGPGGARYSRLAELPLSGSSPEG